MPAPLAALLLALPACTFDASSPDSGPTDSGSAIVCADFASQGMGESVAELAIPDECLDPLVDVWADPPATDAMWAWDHLLSQEKDAALKTDQQPVIDAANDVMTGFDDDALFALDVDQHAIAILASSIIAGSIDADDFPDNAYPGTKPWTLGDGCEQLARYADCGLTDFTPSSTCMPPATPPPSAALPPPPAGDDPEDFCNAVFGPTGSTFKCTGTPLSNTLSFIATREAGLSGALWVTVTAAPGTAQEMTWWPVLLAALAGDAPSLVLFQLQDGEAGVLAVHQVSLQVAGAPGPVSEFEQWFKWQLSPVGSEPKEPDFQALDVILPSELTYRAYPTSGGSSFTSVPLQEWQAGQKLRLAGGVEADPVFTKVVGIIDPCRDNGEGPLDGDACAIRAEAWNELGSRVVAASQETTFEPRACP